MEKQIVSVGKITANLIGGVFLFGILFGIAYNIIYAILMGIFNIENMLLTTILSILLQIISTLLIWKCSTSSTFNKYTISSSYIPKIMRNLFIFTIVICSIYTVYSLTTINKTIETEIVNNSELKLSDMFIEKFYSQEQINEYNYQKEQAINEAKNKVYTYSITLLICNILINFLVLIPEKKFIQNYTIE